MTRVVVVAVKTVTDNVASIVAGLNFGKFFGDFVETVILKRFFSVKKFIHNFIFTAKVVFKVGAVYKYNQIVPRIFF